MYDVVLISPHYHYDQDNKPHPAYNHSHYQDLSMIVPLGIAHIAQYLHECGFSARLVHLPHEIHNLQRFGIDTDTLDQPIKEVLRRYPARVCGIQSHFYLYCGGVVRISEIYKELFPDSTILVGGYMATACWKEFMAAAPGIDGVVLGEGEKTMQTVLEKAPGAGHGFLNTIDGVASRGGDAYVYNPPRIDHMLNLDAMPIIKPHAAPFGNIAWPRRSFLNISRGLCPEGCAYCVANNRDITPRGFHPMPIDRIIRQLRVYQEHGIRGVFLGENHFLNRSFMRELIEAIIREDLDLYFELETHPCLFEDKGLLEKMVAAGFLRYTMGCESGSNNLLKRIGRRSNGRQIMDGVRQIAQAGGLVLTSWICNLPGETEAEFQETQAMLRRVVDAGGFIYWIENLHVLPGSPLHAHPERWQIELLLKNLDDWFRWSLVSKTYVDLEDAVRAPQRYLTHLNHNTPPHEMIRRLYAQRRLARELVPDMQANLAARSSRLPSELTRSEGQKLDWYEEKGWKLLLF